jgi:D-methionine transport system substrate-binding protein
LRELRGEKMLKKIVLLILALTLLFTLAACTATGSKTPDQDAASNNVENGEKSNEPLKIKLATIPNIEPRLQIAKEILKEINVELEIVVFDGNAMPATALKDGDVDGILVNHLKWINTFNAANNSNLVMVEPYYYYSPIRMYSKKWKSVAEFPEGAVISVSNDPSNLEIALNMLQKEGLITLGEKTGDFYTEVDIIENPKNIKLVMAETINVAKSIDDVDAVISFAFYAVRAGGVKAEDFLSQNDTDKEECPVGIIVQDGNQNAEWAKYLAENLIKDKWTDKADEVYPPGCYPYYK